MERLLAGRSPCSLFLSACRTPETSERSCEQQRLWAQTGGSPRASDCGMGYCRPEPSKALRRSSGSYAALADFACIANYALLPQLGRASQNICCRRCHEYDPRRSRSPLLKTTPPFYQGETCAIDWKSGFCPFVGNEVLRPVPRKAWRSADARHNPQANCNDTSRNRIPP